MSTSIAASSIHPLGQGFLLGVSMIIAIGPQNLFILRQGLRRQHLFATALFSTLADIVLISIGVGGVGGLISANSGVQALITIGGILFLIWYGGQSLYSAWDSEAAKNELSLRAVPIGVQATVVAALSFAFLNPSTYFDTLVIIGSKSIHFAIDERLIFAIGAVLASAFWFFMLTYGASKLSPLFRTRIAWRILDSISGCIMIAIAATMLSTLA